MKFYGYFRSSAAFRVRIALALKGLEPEQHYVHLTKGGGQQFDPEYMKLNPAALVPTVIDDGAVLTQSLAIIEYLDEKYPSEPRLLPGDAASRARVRSLALLIACEIHPLNNLRVLNYLTKDLGQTEEVKNRWYLHWIAKGFSALEAMLADDARTGLFCHGDRPSMADVFLVPQVFNAKRFNADLKPYPRLMGIFENCMKLPAFDKSQPSKQPDAE